MSGFKEILKHSSNYLIASLATRALAFISIPVYTRLLSTEDYGIVSVFLGIVSILNVLVAFNFDTSISRYFYDKTSDSDFKNFVGTTLISSLFFIILSSIVFFYFADKFSIYLNLPVRVVYFLVPMATLNLIGLIFIQIYQPQKLSKPVALSSLFRVYLGFACSISLILIFKSERYLGQILGQILAGILMLFYWGRKIYPYVKLKFNRSHLKYILSYSVPLIPYALSGVLIEQFGKITLGKVDGISQAGFYTLAVSVASITAIVTEVTHMAWYPYYMEYMKSQNYKQHDKDLFRIFKLTLVAAMSVAAFGHEIGLILAKREFTSALYLVPILVLGYVFHQFSYAYMRNVSYVKKTVYMSLIVLSAGIINVLLNSFFIPLFGEVGAAASFVISYLCMALGSWSISFFILKVHCISIKKMFGLVLLLIFFIVPLFFIFNLENYLLKISLKVSLCGIFICILLFKDKDYIIAFIKKLTVRLH